jgi:hypothetical protein
MKRFCCSILTLTLLLNLSTNIVFAETDPEWGSQSPFINVPPNNYNDQWKKPMEAAASAWTSTPTPVVVSTLSSSKNKVLAGSYTDTWYGIATSANPGPFTIKLNSRTINRDATNFYNFVKSTLVHEYGHIFSLDHTTKTAIMNSNRDRNTMTNPQQFDIDEVNSVYN